MRVARAVAAIVFSSALALTGCSEPEPIEGEPTPEPSAEAPTMPQEASEDSPEGAVAFVKHYIELLNYASDSGDVDALREASDPDCEGCNSYIKFFETTYMDGGYIKDPGWAVEGDILFETTGEAIDVFVTVDAPANEYREDSDSDVEKGESGEYDLYFQMKNDGTRQIDLFERQSE